MVKKEILLLEMESSVCIRLQDYSRHKQTPGPTANARCTRVNHLHIVVEFKVYPVLEWKD
jgi:hypothetical protein